MNNNLIKLSKTKHLPNFPILLTGKHRRCLTKHYTNLSLYLYIEEQSLLSFLIYQCSADNCFKHSTALLNRYAAAIEMCYKEYKGRQTITNIYHVRRLLQVLIEKGLILHTNKDKVFMINPMLTYECDIINKKQYQLIMEMYQQGDVNKLTDYFISLVSEFLESKKKNYIYRNKK